MAFYKQVKEGEGIEMTEKNITNDGDGNKKNIRVGIPFELHFIVSTFLGNSNKKWKLQNYKR